jgi:hypothetical protein
MDDAKQPFLRFWGETEKKKGVLSQTPFFFD